MQRSGYPLDLLVDGQLTLPVVAHAGEGVFRALLGCAGALHMSQLSGDLHSSVGTERVAGGCPPAWGTGRQQPCSKQAVVMKNAIWGLRVWLAGASRPRWWE